MIHSLTVFCALASVAAFAPAKQTRASQALNVRSKSVPFIEQPPALDGSLPGDVGFDPLGLSSLWPDKDWGENVVPSDWLEATDRTPIKTIDWMREAEVKHGRMCMMAVLGWVAVDMGLRFPGDQFSAIPNSLAAHDAAVANGSMGFLLLVVSFLELMTGAAIYDQSRGSGRVSGEFNFDPLNFSKDPAAKSRYLTNEIKNGRLAMLAFSGIVTQAALFPEKSFPFF
mmetsp:Transcript_40707/g.41563  ORF Transcript_40707/g.41563 Transcript_40707/m.41563 type:complete len:227 (-) Transcript_40707:164-844(-)|eukprot:CAMPEP_0182427156 /NCGR_PEP_ID=MMETSP1167-20130531/14979_1 /TAXON_ID=2988 /ORGANISM="Mallomonas Sp, Strain CCMP3275" /LENGTH=226 /DNA_ID=CAMNT_0024609151 /DNA_START=63 /DNA_END=743 /DNA_ORIENTATION=-